MNYHKNVLYVFRRLLLQNGHVALITRCLWTAAAQGCEPLWPLAVNVCVCVRASQPNTQIWLCLYHWLCLRLQSFRISTGLNEVWLPARAQELELTWESPRGFSEDWGREMRPIVWVVIPRDASEHCENSYSGRCRLCITCHRTYQYRTYVSVCFVSVRQIFQQTTLQCNKCCSYRQPDRSSKILSCISSNCL